eukprot:scaffold34110_cov183-Amphora_coffeaeformis.AAC.4
MKGVCVFIIIATSSRHSRARMMVIVFLSSVAYDKAVESSNMHSNICPDLDRDELLESTSGWN